MKPRRDCSAIASPKVSPRRSFHHIWSEFRPAKNLIGAIHHPALIIADVRALESLPPKELRQGYAEIIKHSIIRDAEMFRTLSARTKRQSGLDSTSGFVALIRRNIAIKARIV